MEIHQVVVEITARFKKWEDVYFKKLKSLTNFETWA